MTTERIKYAKALLRDLSATGEGTNDPKCIREIAADELLSDDDRALLLEYAEHLEQPPAAGEAAPALEIVFGDRHNRADIYAGKLLIGEAYTGGRNSSTPEKKAWLAVERACNSHAALVEVAALVLKSAEDAVRLYPENTPMTAGMVAAATKARAALTLAKGGK